MLRHIKEWKALRGVRKGTKAAAKRWSKQIRRNIEECPVWAPPSKWRPYGVGISNNKKED